MKAIISPSPQTICLLGFMGAGKTTVAAELAKLLEAAWLDLDEFIEARENRTVPQIIENLSEEVFREIESNALQEVLKIKTPIVALGGGTWTILENRRLIEENKCRTVWLNAPFELCWQRILDPNVSRPLARDKSIARELFDKRLEIYQMAEIYVSVNSRRTAAAIAAEIMQQVSPAPAKQKKIDKAPRSR